MIIDNSAIYKNNFHIFIKKKNKMGKNNNLHNAKTEKKDEFYTQYEDIEKEMKYYKEYFENKVVFCNCDDPLESNFTKYFILKFKSLKLKKLICTFYDVNNEKIAFAFEYQGEDMNGDGIISEEDIRIIRESGASRTILVDDKDFNFEEKEKCWAKGIYGCGDFRSRNVIEYLKQADVVVTNPPFSLFREYVKQLMDFNKKFIIIGNQNAITYKEIFPYIKNNQLWLGTKGIGDMSFVVPNNYETRETRSWKDENGTNWRSFGNICWFTNIEHRKRSEILDLYKEYNSTDYPKYDNYDAIEVSRVENIPMDYDGVMGVPITFLGKYNPTQFQIIGIANNVRYIGDFPCLTIINGQKIYNRVLIKKIF
jgi:nuclear transport factor 2 (NTF2) superfamily protein